MFESQLGKKIKVYIDDTVVKSKLEFEHVNNLGNILEILRKHNLCPVATPGFSFRGVKSVLS